LLHPNRLLTDNSFPLADLNEDLSFLIAAGLIGCAYRIAFPNMRSA
jgi:hypothetical protein